MSLSSHVLKALQGEGLDLDAVIRVAEASEKRSDNTGAERQARHRAKKKSNGVTVTRDGSPNDIDILTPTLVTPIEPNGSKPLGKFPPPDGVTKSQWHDFLAVRRTKRAGTMTETAYGRLCSKLLKLAEDGWPPGEMVGLAVERGWTSVFAPKDFGNERSGDPTTIAVQRLLGAHAGTG